MFYKIIGKSVLISILTIVFTLTTSRYALAWKTSQEADSFCDSTKAKINASFTNTENNSSLGMLVTPTDLTTGIKGETKTINAGDSANWVLDLNKDNISNGQIEFYLEWSNGNKGTDTRKSSYNPIDCRQPETSCENCGSIEKIKNISLDIDKKVRFEGDDSWKDKVTGVKKDEVIEFRLKITNTGTKTLSNIKVTDKLPDALERIGGSGLTEYFGDLEPGEKKTYVLKVKVKEEFLNEEKCVVNRAYVEHDNDKKAEDYATVCYGIVEITQLPETGASYSILISLVGVSFLTFGIKLRGQYEK